MKASPPSSRVCTPVIKYEPTSTADDNEREGDLAGVPSLGMVTQSGAITVGITGDGSAALPGDCTDDEQPCDLRLSAFPMNLVSMAIQRAALQSIAAAPSTHLTSLMNFPHSHVGTHAQLTTQTTAQSRALSPTRRYSISTSTATGNNVTGVGAGVVPSNRDTTPPLTGSGVGVVVGGNMNTVPLTTGTSAPSITSGGPSTSAAAAAAAAAGNTTLIIGSSCGDEAAIGAGVLSNSSSAAGSSHMTAITSGTGGGGTFGGAYTCERCGNSYARPHSLNRHMRFECGVEPKFECPICHKKSKHKHNLVLHMRTHQHR